MDKDRNIESAKMEDVDVQNIDANEEEQHRYPWYAIKLYGPEPEKCRKISSKIKVLRLLFHKNMLMWKIASTK